MTDQTASDLVDCTDYVSNPFVNSSSFCILCMNTLINTEVIILKHSSFLLGSLVTQSKSQAQGEKSVIT